jgi:hypothetical protein
MDLPGPAARLEVKRRVLSPAFEMGLAIRQRSARFGWALPPVASSPLHAHPSFSPEKHYVLPAYYHLLCRKFPDELQYTALQ